MNSTLSASAVLLFASWTSIALAGNSQAAGSSGTIHFVGAIVESLCAANMQQKRFEVSCMRAGQASVKTLALDSTSRQTLPDNIGIAQISWLDRQHQHGIVTINYQ